MTRRDYVAIAATIRAQRDALQCDPSACDAIDAIANGLADTMKADNPSFDRERFLQACGTH